MPDVTPEITAMTEAMREALDHEGVELTRDVLNVGAIAAFAALTEPGMILADRGGPRQGPPADGAWPCQEKPPPGWAPPNRLQAFLYVLLRDGATAPGDVEQHAINAGRSPSDTKFTNPHLTAYARSLAYFLTTIGVTE